MHLISKHELRPTRWKNGGGITREIATVSQAGNHLFRLSMADVSHSGEFSNFAGLTRILTIIHGGAMRLKIGDDMRDVHLWEPVVFDGGADTHAQLLGAGLTDLNLMFDPATCTARVDIIRDPQTFTLSPSASQVYAVHSLRGAVSCVKNGDLSRGDTLLLCTTQTTLNIGDEGAILLVSVVPNLTTTLDVQLG